MIRSRGLWLHYLLMGIAFAYLYPATKSQEINQNNYRLPTYIIPTRYEIHLIISKFKTDSNVSNAFYGEINITFTATKEKAKEDPIILNSKYLSIQEVKLDDVLITEYAIFDTFERLVINNTIEDNHNHTLTLKYKGIINFDMTGIFSDFYQQGDSNTTQTFWYIATQMAPVYARSVFPCLDEPTFKARVKLRVSYPNIFKVAVSNTEGITSSDNLTTTTFKETAEMSTYLIGFVLCEENFTLDERFVVAGVPYKIRFRPQFRKLAYRYPLLLSLRIVNEYEEITGIPYVNEENETIRKVEQVAMPHFLQRAIGNWGLILYREQTFLWDEDQSSAEAKQIVATNIARKLGQMWFENLKTPEWWNTAWISEGFATFYQFEILAKIECHWEMENQLVAETFLKAMHFDYPSGRPLSLPEASVLDSHSIVATADRTFDVVIPFKGAAILRMMRILMGKDLFNKGVKKFLSKRRSDVVTPQYFWDSWEESDLTNGFPKPLNEIMEGWINRPGFPFVFVDVNSKYKIEISAKRLYDPLNQTRLDNVWYIPITYTLSFKDLNFEDTVPKLWLTNSEKVVLDLDMKPDRRWILVNLQYSAYIRVNYQGLIWFRLRIILGLNPKLLPVLNRIQLIDDVITLALLGEVPYARMIYTLRYLKYETNYWPWYTALKNFETLKQWLENAEINKVNTFLRSLFDNVYLSITNDFGHTSSLKRALLWKAACEMNYGSCLKEMTRIFKEFTESGVEVEPDLRFIVYCTGLRSKDGIQFWDTLYARMIKTKVPSEDGVIIQALGCTEDVNILKRYLEKFLEKNSPLNPYNSEDIKKVLSAVMTNSRSGSEALMAFLEENAKDIVNYSRFIHHSISSLAFSIRNEMQLKMMENLAAMPEMRSYGILFNKHIAVGKTTLKWSQNLRKGLMEGFQVETKWIKLERKQQNSGIVATATKTLTLFLITATFL